MTVLTVLLVLLASLFGDRPVPAGAGTWPLAPRPAIAEGFDPPTDPWGRGHRGVDLLGRPGQSVRSALPGVVAFAGAVAGKGVVVVVHGAHRTTYEPLDPSVDVGAVVAAGDVIGTLRLADGHCLPAACLHWGLIRGSTYLDPLTLVGAGPVRLLPISTGWKGPAPVAQARGWASR